MNNGDGLNKKKRIGIPQLLTGNFPLFPLVVFRKNGKMGNTYPLKHKKKHYFLSLL